MLTRHIVHDKYRAGSLRIETAKHSANGVRFSAAPWALSRFAGLAACEMLGTDHWFHSQLRAFRELETAYSQACVERHLRMIGRVPLAV